MSEINVTSTIIIIAVYGRKVPVLFHCSKNVDKMLHFIFLWLKSLNT